MSAKQVTGSSNLPVARVGVLGFGGLGQAAARVLVPKREMKLVAAADKHGYVYSEDGLDASGCISTYQSLGSVGYLEPYGKLSSESVEELINISSLIRQRIQVYLPEILML